MVGGDDGEDVGSSSRLCLTGNSVSLSAVYAMPHAGASHSNSSPAKKAREGNGLLIEGHYSA
jgi:hypothetical protein